MRTEQTWRELRKVMHHAIGFNDSALHLRIEGRMAGEAPRHGDITSEIRDIAKAVESAFQTAYQPLGFSTSAYDSPNGRPKARIWGGEADAVYLAEVKATRLLGRYLPATVAYWDIRADDIPGERSLQMVPLIFTAGFVLEERLGEETRDYREEVAAALQGIWPVVSSISFHAIDGYDGTEKANHDSAAILLRKGKRRIGSGMTAVNGSGVIFPVEQKPIIDYRDSKIYAHLPVRRE